MKFHSPDLDKAARLFWQVESSFCCSGVSLALDHHTIAAMSHLRADLASLSPSLSKVELAT